MNSNSENKVIPIGFLQSRDTFGIIDPTTGEKYADLIRCYLHARPVFFYELASTITSPSAKDFNNYKVHCDTKTRKVLKEKGEANCIISFQQRTTGNFAYIRLFKEE